jgi:hypothetical protein
MKKLLNKKDKNLIILTHFYKKKKDLLMKKKWNKLKDLEKWKIKVKCTSEYSSIE